MDQAQYNSTQLIVKLRCSNVNNPRHSRIMCIIGDIIEGLLLGQVTVATKPSEYEFTNIWSIRHINTLPRELVLYILRFLNTRDLKMLMLVNKEWKTLAEDPVLWKKFKLVVDQKKVVHLHNILSLARFECLEHLEINGYGEKDRTVVDQTMLATVSDSSLTRLTLKNCDMMHLSDDNIETILSNLRSLSLWQVNMSTGQVRALFQSLTRNKRLQELDIGYGYLDLDHIEPELMSRALNRRRRVNLCHARLSESQLSSLFQTISRKTNIRTLDVGYRDLAFIDTTILKTALQRLENVNICSKKFITTPYLFSNKAANK